MKKTSRCSSFILPPSSFPEVTVCSRTLLSGILPPRGKNYPLLHFPLASPCDAAVPSVFMSGPWIDVLSAGRHRGELYTKADLDAIARNFALARGIVDPPLVIGHEETQPLLAGVVANTGDPAIGWVDAVKVIARADKLGRPTWVLRARLADVFPLIERLVRVGAYRKVSAEVYDEPPEGSPPGCRGKMLRRVALLGGELPQIKTLLDLPAASFSERAWLAKHAEGGTAMDRAQMEAILLGAGWTQEEIDQIKDDTVLGLIVTHEVQETGGGTAPAMQEPPPTPPDRATMTADLIAAGHDAAELEALSDADLAALWQQEIGGTAMMGELETEGAPVEVTTSLPPVVPTPAPAPTPTRAPRATPT